MSVCVNAWAFGIFSGVLVLSLTANIALALWIWQRSKRLIRFDADAHVFWAVPPPDTPK